MTIAPPSWRFFKLLERIRFRPFCISYSFDIERAFCIRTKKGNALYQLTIRLLFAFSIFQAMHFFYGLGAFISPMIAAPFLVNIDCTPLVDGVTSSSNSLRITRAQHLSKSRTAFVILGSIQVNYSHVIF